MTEFQETNKSTVLEWRSLSGPTMASMNTEPLSVTSPVFGSLVVHEAEESLVDIFDSVFSYEPTLVANDELWSAFEDGVESSDGTTKRKRMLNETQKIAKRVRNREHAKQSRTRKKFLLKSLEQTVRDLEAENAKWKQALNIPVNNHKESTGDALSSIVKSTQHAAIVTPDLSLLKALQSSAQNFFITDPTKPSNPIIYASQGFLETTGYALEEVLGRNCTFLQGSDTDPQAVKKIEHCLATGDDTTVLLRHHRKDGSSFYNQLYLTGLRDCDGVLINFLGVQCPLSEEMAEKRGI